MNKTKKRSIIILLVVMLIGTLSASHIIAMAASSGEVTTKVTNSSQLYAAVRNAKDGDVIGIDGNIIIAGQETKVGDPGKHVTLKRMNSSSSIRINTEFTFENVTFDGANIAASSSFVGTNGEVTFQNVTFRNGINNNSAGGAVNVFGNTANFYYCTFEDNIGTVAGHMYVGDSANVTVESSIFKNGHSKTYGGAIMNGKNTASIKIISSTITGNSAERHGGGVTNRGNMYITGTKIYNNTAPNGSDISNYPIGALQISDTIPLLQILFKDDGIIPKGWIKDYDNDVSLSDPDIEPSLSNSLLKLDYDIAPTEVILSPSSLGIASDSKIIGLEAGKYYKIKADDEVYYSNADGSLTTNETEAELLTGTEIIGLTNGVIYLVEEYIPPIEEPEIPDEDEEPIDQEEPKDEEVEEDPDKDPPASTTNNITNSNNTSYATHNTTDNSTTHHSRDESSTINNYSYDHSTHTTTEKTYLPTSNGGNGEKGGQASANQHQTITVDYGSIADGLKVQDDGKNITINVNVNVQPDEEVVEAFTSNLEAAEPSPGSINVTWIELVKMFLLFGIFICVIRRSSA